MAEFPNPYTKPVLTLMEYAKLMGIGKTTAYRHVHDGSIPSVMLTEHTRGIPTAKLYDLLGLPLPPAPSEDPVKH